VRLVGSFTRTAWLLTDHFADVILGARAWEQPGHQIDHRSQKNRRYDRVKNEVGDHSSGGLLTRARPPDGIALGRNQQ